MQYQGVLKPTTKGNLHGKSPDVAPCSAESAGVCDGIAILASRDPTWCNACITFIIHAFIHYNTVMVSKNTFFCGTCWTLWTHYQMAGHNVSPWGQPGNLVIKERALACAYLYTLYVEAKICRDNAIYFQRTLKDISINPVECWRWSMWKIIIAWRNMQPAFPS